MPRRPSKLKRSGKSKARPVNRAESKMKRWDKSSDIPMDEEDQCNCLFFVLRTRSPIPWFQVHASRDKILLEGEESGSEHEEDDEVFALKGLSEEDSDLDDDDGYGDGMDMEEEPEPKKKQESKKSKSKKSSSQVLSESGSENSESEDETWGRNKGAYYSSNAAQLESDDEEANALEEQEAIRLQAKVRGALCEDDFGLGDSIALVEGHGKIEYVSYLLFSHYSGVYFWMNIPKPSHRTIFGRRWAVAPRQAGSYSTPWKE